MSDIVKFAWKSSTNKEAKFICVGECKTHGLLLSEGGDWYIQMPLDESSWDVNPGVSFTAGWSLLSVNEEVNYESSQQTICKHLNPYSLFTEHLLGTWERP